MLDIITIIAWLWCWVGRYSRHCHRQIGAQGTTCFFVSFVLPRCFPQNQQATPLTFCLKSTSLMRHLMCKLLTFKEKSTFSISGRNWGDWFCIIVKYISSVCVRVVYFESCQWADLDSVLILAMMNFVLCDKNNIHCVVSPFIQLFSNIFLMLTFQFVPEQPDMLIILLFCFFVEKY